ncbi:hypothetical protein ECE50_020770 [Chitinophaga sp. Mgbs1]|uniref:Uncharacterized protein n=1 Tax=Chitinophaga solisilvae TaxID=1233460 RepID=A0A433WNX8_9BACT|nr:hypothetical protein [Chitinophaga solisilvae]
MKKLFVSILLLSTVSSYARQAVDGLFSPESAVAYKNGYFISNMGPKLEPAAKDGDGAIAWTENGRVQSPRYFNDTLHAPKGLEIAGNTLYVADIDHLKGYDLNSRKKVFDLNLENSAGMLNDVARVNDSLLLVSDCVKDQVLLINTRSKEVTVLQGTMPAVNGVWYDAQTDIVYACAMGRDMDGTGLLYQKRLGNAGEAFVPVKGSPVGLFDGIVQLDARYLLLSDWITVKNPQSGYLCVYDLQQHTYRRIPVKHSPADLALDKRRKALLIPFLLDNRMEAVPLKSLGI